MLLLSNVRVCAVEKNIEYNACDLSYANWKFEIEGKCVSKRATKRVSEWECECYRRNWWRIAKDECI